jgi:pimeloyl-ACP methyl ester carboxylesterase
MSDIPVSPAKQRRVSVGDIELSIAEYGTAGPPLILLHGIGSRGVSWWPVIDELAAHFRLIVPDLRGHGDSDKPASGYFLTDYAGDLAGLIDALDLDRPSILGHSLGGAVTLVWAVFHPDRAERIALEDVPLRAGARSVPLFDDWLALASLTVEDAAAHYQREHPDWTDEECHRRAISITSTAPPVFTELRDSTTDGEDLDRIALLAGIRSPVLLVRGDPESGSMVVPDDATRLAAIVPNARHAHIPGREHTEAFLAAVLPFLRGEQTGS